MRRYCWLAVILVLLAPFAEGQDREQPFQLKMGYASQKASLLISPVDIYCSFFIAHSVDHSIRLLAAIASDPNRIGFSDGDKMLINRGADHGLSAGDRFLVIGRGKPVYNAINSRVLGDYYQKKSQAVVTSLNTDRSIITLENGCHPVHVGDLLQPFEAREPVVKEKIDYRNCRVSADSTFAQILFMDLDSGYVMSYSGSEDYLVTGLSDRNVSPGDFVLLSRIVEKNTPPLIFGSAITIHSEAETAIVKILDLDFPVEPGDRVSKYEVESVALTSETSADPEPVTPEKKPAAETVIETNISSMSVDILFVQGTSLVDAAYLGELDRLTQFLKDSSEVLVIIRSFSSPPEGAETDVTLAQTRVEALKALLIKEGGITADSIETYLHGVESATTVEQDKGLADRLVRIQVLKK